LPDGQLVTLPAERVFHMPGLSFDGLSGYSPIALAKNSIGLTSAAEQFGAAFFGRGTTPTGILETPNTLKPEAQANLRESWNALQSGLSNAHRVAILEQGVTWKALGIPNNHAQFLETRKFQVAEIARLFRVPPHMLADLESGASYASVEQMSLDFVAYTLRPWLVRWEQTINYDLFGSRERSEMFSEHLVDGLLRGDIVSRYNAYAVGRNWGWLSADDIREMENMNPLPDNQGEMYLVPLNMVSAKNAGQPAPSPGGAARERSLE
jgi:HK97 family phage portal protein